MCVKSNCAWTGNFAHWQMPERKHVLIKEKSTPFLWHLRTGTPTKWQTQFLCPEGLPRKQRNEKALYSPDQISNLSDILYDSKPNTPDAEKKKKNQHNGKTHGKPICSASTKNNLCQVHQRVGLKRSSHFIIEVGSSRVGLPVNVVPRSAFRTFILVILQKKKWTEEMSSPYII